MDSKRILASNGSSVSSIPDSSDNIKTSSSFSAFFFVYVFFIQMSRYDLNVPLVALKWLIALFAVK